VALAHALDDARKGIPVGHVELDYRFRRAGNRRTAADVGEHDRGPGLVERAPECRSDRAGPAGHQRDLAPNVELLHRSTSSRTVRHPASGG
jgi:hypothetical protein